ncbi:hypothetical protein G7Y89_g10977 [Cudoniella acicularis]|uniref:Heterokaryon incompatibility domain-containing protein n=1 Tax=Cudoniella acicularis TaxID=354080 RepID=A0A8H4W128_9HELO|nr:hypothetical protein G7Y89_g10977 [Cudoniella acicularis]
MSRYTPLRDPRSIWLLRLAKDPESGKASYDLEIESLAEDPDYLALSYTWGSVLEYDTVPIAAEGNETSMFYDFHCGEALFQIPATLHDVLFSLESEPPFTPLIWIDFFCISQDDQEEKAIQIQLMGEIYSTAIGILLEICERHCVDALWRTMVVDSDGPTQTSIGFYDWVRGKLAYELVHYMGIGDDKQTGDYVKSLDILDQLQPSPLPSKDEVMEYAASVAVLTVLRNNDKHEFIREGEEIRDSAFIKVEGQQRLFTNLFEPISVDKRLYRRSRGHPGLGPASTLPGGEIWLLQGVAVLLIMRTHPEKSNILIGETYLHGFMHIANVYRTAFKKHQNLLGMEANRDVDYP